MKKLIILSEKERAESSPGMRIDYLTPIQYVIDYLDSELGFYK